MRVCVCVVCVHACESECDIIESEKGGIRGRGKTRTRTGEFCNTGNGNNNYVLIITMSQEEDHFTLYTHCQ